MIDYIARARTPAFPGASAPLYKRVSEFRGATSLSYRFNMKIRVKRLHAEAHLPEYAHGPAEDAGMDVRSIENVDLQPGVPHAVATGLSFEIPSGYEMQVRPRSGLALKHAVMIPNAPGTIDPGYRGELKVILLNAGNAPYQIHSGDKIAQVIVARYEAVEWDEGELAESSRGAGGFGSSGR